MTNPPQNSDDIDELYILIDSHDWDNKDAYGAESRKLAEEISSLIDQKVREARIEEIHHFLDIWHNDDSFGTHNFRDRIEELNKAKGKK